MQTDKQFRVNGFIANKNKRKEKTKLNCKIKQIKEHRPI